ncbi:MAG: hypothetical protein FWG66_16080 [Spirochaetes bacterium]|nr:hypothetical protein [Spirochaetota bacterium]
MTLSDNADELSANREIKDGVFKLLFEVPENAAELYSALKDTECRPDEIEIITITTTVSGRLKNDLAIVARGEALFLAEHMSSFYENMPVRFLMYLGQLYEKWIKMKGEERFLYGSRLYKIPAPEFAVFYNGAAAKPEKEILRLSSAFENAGGEGLGFIELEVPVYNINKGMNEELFKKSGKLRQYAEFIAKIRELNGLYEDHAQAVKEAANYCIANDILADFLKEHGGKVVSILSTVYDEEAAKRVYAEEYAETRTENIALEMMKMGLSQEQVLRATKISQEKARQIAERLDFSLPT